jgi:hypothetical protein
MHIRTFQASCCSSRRDTSWPARWRQVLTAARKAHDHDKGSVYVALFNIATGLERFFKAVVIAEHMASHALVAPSKKQLRDYGHDLRGLYDTCVVIGTKHGHALTPRFEFDALDNGIVDLLSDFGEGARYHNLDQLGGAPAIADPLARWASLLGLAADDVSDGVKTRIRAGAAATALLMADSTMVIMTGLNGTSLILAEALERPFLQGAAAPYLVWRLVKLIDSFVPVLDSACRAVNELAKAALLPVSMPEFFQWLWADRAHVLRKRKWP